MSASMGASWDGLLGSRSLSACALVLVSPACPSPPNLACACKLLAMASWPLWLFATSTLVLRHADARCAAFCLLWGRGPGWRRPAVPTSAACLPPALQLPGPLR